MLQIQLHILGIAVTFSIMIDSLSLDLLHASYLYMVGKTLRNIQTLHAGHKRNKDRPAHAIRD